MTSRAAILAEARTWLGTPYHHRARCKGAGVDCAQILIAVFHAVGLVDDIDAGDYPRDWMLHRTDQRFRDFVRRHADQIDPAAVMPGDVALYRVGHCFAHGAIVIAWPLLIHADSKSRRVTLAEGDAGWLAGRPVEFYRARGIDGGGALA